VDYAGALIEREDGKLLFQLRDNNPRIKNQNLWSLFGGGIKNNEMPIDAIIRELKEELGIKVKKEQLLFFMTFYGFKKNRYIYKLKLNKNLNLKLGEGASMDFFTQREMLFKKNVVNSLRFFLLVYPLLDFKNSFFFKFKQ
jgi:8-oxo-dGTP diphosphatase